MHRLRICTAVVAILAVADVRRRLQAANQGSWTIQTMVFEPAALKIHLSIGAGPTSARPLTTIDLAPLLRTRIEESRQ